jgi:endonuclease/exonuclease/phosphatase family metal-dependent hydrolase
MRNFIKKGLVAATVLVLLCYIPSLFVYLISPARFWPFGIVSIVFFYILVVQFLCAGVWWFFNRKVSFLLLLLTIASFPILKNVFAFHLPHSFELAKKPGSYRIMQWNCQGLPGISNYNRAWLDRRSKVVQFIQTYQPDIICLQDLGVTIGPGLNSNIALLKDTLHYPYYVFEKHYFSRRSWGNTWIGIAIFSKFPIIDSGYIDYPDKINPESILWADINLKGRITRVATTHLQSMHLNHNLTVEEPLDTAQWQDSLVIIWGSKLDKLRYFQSYHAQEVEKLHRFIDSSKGRFILAADLNSVPSSYVYHRAKDGLKDAFLEKGSGLGRTFHSRQPALRIDYLFHDDGISVNQINIFPQGLSDHDPVIMDFELR